MSDLEKAALELGLPRPDAFCQDWGVCQVDGARAAEFMEFHGTRTWPMVVQLELSDLALGSVLEAIGRGTTSDLLDALAIRFLTRCWEQTPDRLVYWVEFCEPHEDGAEFIAWLQRGLGLAPPHVVGGPWLYLWSAVHRWRRVWGDLGNRSRRDALSALHWSAEELRAVCERLPAECGSAADIRCSLSDETWKATYALASDLLDGRIDIEWMDGGIEVPDAWLWLNLADAVADIDAELRSGLIALDAGSSARVVLGHLRFTYSSHWGNHVNDLIDGIGHRLPVIVADGWP